MLGFTKLIAMLSILSFAACAEVGAAQPENETADELTVDLLDSQRPIPADRLTVHANALGAPGQIAFGTINGSGAKVTGSTNWTSTLDAGLSRYLVTITGESYFFSSYATTVTAMGGTSNVACTTDSIGGKLIIGCRNSATGAAVLPFVAFSTSKP